MDKNNKISEFFSPVPSEYKPYQTLDCSRCHKPVTGVSPQALGVTCSICVMDLVEPPRYHKTNKPSKSDRPRGWHFLKIFVDPEGNVFERGVENPKLKGTLPVTTSTEKTKVRLTKDQKRHLLQEASTKYSKLQKELIAATTKKQSKIINSEIKRQRRIINKYKKSI